MTKHCSIKIDLIKYDPMIWGLSIKLSYFRFFVNLFEINAIQMIDTITGKYFANVNMYNARISIEDTGR